MTSQIHSEFNLPLPDVKSLKEKQNHKFRRKSYMQTFFKQLSLFFLYFLQCFQFFKNFLTHPNYRLVC